MPLIKYVILIYILIFSLNNIYASEGFYFYDDIPKNVTGLAKSNTIEKTLLASGAFSLKRDRKLNKIDTQNYFIQKCKDPRISLWFESDCKKVNECISSKVENCNFESVSYCSGVVVEIKNKTYFATAKHCGTSSPLFKAKFLSKNKKSIIEVPLVKTPQSEKSLPYDIALYDIPNWISLNRKAVKLSFKISNNEPVFSVGFPFTVYRTEKNGQYSDALMPFTFPSV